MANSRSSKKRIKINKRNNIQNNSYKSSMKSREKIHLNLIKEYKNNNQFIQGGSIHEDAKRNILASLSLVISSIDKAVKKKIVHKNTGIRKKNSLLKKTFITL